MSEKVLVTTGKRKMSIARATIKSGKGIVRVNGHLVDALSNKTIKDKIKEPLILAGDLANKVDISVKVLGGGYISQAEAVRNAIARALLNFSGDNELKKTFLDYDRHLLVSDVRRTEPHKSCRSSARRGKQTSKR